MSHPAFAFVLPIREGGFLLLYPRGHGWGGHIERSYYVHECRLTNTLSAESTAEARSAARALGVTLDESRMGSFVACDGENACKTIASLSHLCARISEGCDE